MLPFLLISINSSGAMCVIVESISYLSYYILIGFGITAITLLECIYNSFTAILKKCSLTKTFTKLTLFNNEPKFFTIQKKYQQCVCLMGICCRVIALWVGSFPFQKGNFSVDKTRPRRKQIRYRECHPCIKMKRVELSFSRQINVLTASVRDKRWFFFDLYSFV